MSQPLVRALPRDGSRIIVAQMPVTTSDSVLQHDRIRPEAKHLDVVICFDHQNLDVVHGFASLLRAYSEIVNNSRARARLA